MAFPPAHFLIGCGAAEVVRAFAPVSRWRAWVLAGALAVAPDLDFIVGLAAGSAGAYHGTFTHSIVAVAAVAGVAWVVAGGAWAAVAGAGYASHLLVDMLDDRGRTNVLLGWPFTLEQPHAIARIFPVVHFDQGKGVWGAAISLLHPPASTDLLVQTIVGLVGFAALLLTAWLIRLWRSGVSGRRVAQARD